MSLAYVIVDVFTDTPLQGNQLACRQEVVSSYRAAICAAYCSMMTWRRTFIVSVSWPRSSVKSSSRSARRRLTDRADSRQPDHWLALEPGGSGSLWGCRIESVGVKLPALRLTTRELMSRTRHRTRIQLEQLTGIHECHVVGPGESLPGGRFVAGALICALILASSSS